MKRTGVPAAVGMLFVLVLVLVQTASGAPPSKINWASMPPDVHAKQWFLECKKNGTLPDLSGQWRSDKNVTINLRLKLEGAFSNTYDVEVTDDSEVEPEWKQTQPSIRLVGPPGLGKPWELTFYRMHGSTLMPYSGTLSADLKSMAFEAHNNGRFGDEKWTRLKKVDTVVCPEPGQSRGGMTMEGPWLLTEILPQRGNQAADACRELCAKTVGCAAVVTKLNQTCVLLSEANPAKCKPDHPDTGVWVNPDVKQPPPPPKVTAPAPSKPPVTTTLDRGQDLRDVACPDSSLEIKKGWDSKGGQKSVDACRTACRGYGSRCKALVWKRIRGSSNRGSCMLYSGYNLRCPQ